MKGAASIVGWIIAAVSFLFFVAAFQRNWHAIESASWSASLLIGTAVALPIYLLSLTFAARAWRLLVVALGAAMTVRTARRIFFLSQFAKYLPGNVGHHVGRILLSVREGYRAPLIAGSMVLEWATVTSAALLCASPASLILWRELGSKVELALPRAEIVGFFLLFAGLAAGGIGVFCRHWVHTIYRAVGFSSLRGRESQLLRSFLYHCLIFALGGSMLLILCFSVDPSLRISASEIAVTVGVFAAAWLAGFLVPGAPAGLGVREIVLLAALSPLFGAPTSLLAAAALRLVTTSGDILALLAGKLSVITPRVNTDEIDNTDSMPK